MPINTTIETYEPKDEKFDLIICQNSLHFRNIQNIEEVYDKLKNMLVIGGILYIRSKNVNNDGYIIRDYKENLKELKMNK